MLQIILLNAIKNVLAFGLNIFWFKYNIIIIVVPLLLLWLLLYQLIKLLLFYKNVNII